MPCPSPAATLRRVGPAPHPGNKVELALAAGLLVILSRRHEIRRAGKLTSSDTSQDQNKGFELAHPNNFHMNKLLECINVLASTDPKLYLSDKAKNQIFEESQ